MSYIEPMSGIGLQFHLAVFGYGIGLVIGNYDFMRDSLTIFSWSIIRKHIFWRGEVHSRTRYGYNFRRFKNGKAVEDISFQSPIVSRAA